MGRLYWIGLALVLVGIGAQTIPTGDYRFFTVLAGLLVQGIGAICIFKEFLRVRKAAGGASPRKTSLYLLIGIAMFLVGVVAGFVLVYH